MDAELALARFDQQMRRDAHPDSPLTRVERVGEVVRQVGPGAMWNGVIWSGLDDADERAVDEVIAAQVRDYAALGDVETFEWKLYSHDRPAELGARLRAAGFVPDESEALMVAEAAEIAAIPAPAPEGIELVPVTDAAGIGLVAEVHDAAFGDGTGDRLRARMLAQLEHAPDSMVALVAMAGELPVCSARMDFHQGTEFAGLWGGGTLEEYRGRGIYRALVAYRAQVAVERGFRYLFVDASDDSRPILARLGFTQLSTTTPYEYGITDGS